ncbi:MAG: AAA family ATPase [Arenicellales bacterium]|nr:AAA family ATPase [Arenicellales bacterium]
MKKRLFYRLSGQAYKTLKALGLPMRARPWRQPTARGEWAQAKTALLDEITASRHHSGARHFCHQLLERIEALEHVPATALTTALFKDGVALNEPADTPIAPGADDSTLTHSQTAALAKGRAGRVLFLLGAPGAGKTLVTSRLAGEYVSAGETTLLCCQTRTALDYAVSRLAEHTRQNPCFTARTFAALISEQAREPFDNVIVDEAGMAHLAQVLHLSALARQRIIFVGDPMQLPPVASAATPAAKRWLRRNIFQHQAGTDNLSGLFFWQERNSATSVLLREQYEIPGRLFDLLNHFCYGGRLVCRTPGRGIVSFIDTSKINPQVTGSRRSPVNTDHGEIAAATLAEVLQKKSVHPENVAVLTPFRGQARYLAHLGKLRALPEAIEYATVHTFQGRMKTCVVLDLTASQVAYTYRILEDDNQALALMNTALSRCRTQAGVEGRLVVITNLEHIRARYPNGAVTAFLERLRSVADNLSEPAAVPDSPQAPFSGDTLRYGEVTDRLLGEFERDYGQISAALASPRLPDEDAIRTLIWKVCDLIPRLLNLCNRLSTPGRNYFRITPDKAQRLAELPLSALELANLAEQEQYAGAQVDHFSAVITHLYVLIYESTMATGESAENRPPPPPVYDPDAFDGNSYGRIRLWLKDLRNYYQHLERAQQTQVPFNKTKIDRFFHAAIAKPAPEPPRGYSRLDYLRAELFALKDVVRYLETVRKKLKAT